MNEDVLLRAVKKFDSVVSNRSFRIFTNGFWGHNIVRAKSSLENLARSVKNNHIVMIFNIKTVYEPDPIAAFANIIKAYFEMNLDLQRRMSFVIAHPMLGDKDYFGRVNRLAAVTQAEFNVGESDERQRVRQLSTVQEIMASAAMVFPNKRKIFISPIFISVSHANELKVCGFSRERSEYKPDHPLWGYHLPEEGEYRTVQFTIQSDLWVYPCSEFWGYGQPRLWNLSFATIPEMVASYQQDTLWKMLCIRSGKELQRDVARILSETPVALRGEQWLAELHTKHTKADDFVADILQDALVRFILRKRYAGEPIVFAYPELIMPDLGMPNESAATSPQHNHGMSQGEDTGKQLGASSPSSRHGLELGEQEAVVFSDKALARSSASERAKYTGPAVYLYRVVDRNLFSRIQENGYESVPDEAVMERVESSLFTWLDDWVIHRGRLPFSGKFNAVLEIQRIHYNSEGIMICISIPADLLLEFDILLLNFDAVEYLTNLVGEKTGWWAINQALLDSFLDRESEEAKELVHRVEEVSRKNKERLRRLLDSAPQEVGRFVSGLGEIIMPHSFVNIFVANTRQMSGLLCRQHNHGMSQGEDIGKQHNESENPPTGARGVSSPNVQTLKEEIDRIVSEQLGNDLTKIWEYYSAQNYPEERGFAGYHILVFCVAANSSLREGCTYEDIADSDVFIGKSWNVQSLISSARSRRYLTSIPHKRGRLAVYRINKRGLLLVRRLLKRYTQREDFGSHNHGMSQGEDVGRQSAASSPSTPKRHPAGETGRKLNKIAQALEDLEVSGRLASRVEDIADDINNSLRLAHRAIHDDTQKIFVVGGGLVYFPFIAAVLGRNVVYCEDTMEQLLFTYAAWEPVHMHLMQKGLVSEEVTIASVEGDFAYLDEQRDHSLRDVGVGPGTFDLVTLIDYVKFKPGTKKVPVMVQAERLLKNKGWLVLDFYDPLFTFGPHFAGVETFAKVLHSTLPFKEPAVDDVMFEGSSLAPYSPLTIPYVSANGVLCIYSVFSDNLPFPKGVDRKDLLYYATRPAHTMHGFRILPEEEVPSEIVAASGVDENMRVLSIGGAVIPYYFLERAGSVHCVDINPAQIEYLKLLASIIREGDVVIELSRQRSLLGRFEDSRMQILVDGAFDSAYQIISDPQRRQALRDKLSRISFEEADLTEHNSSGAYDLVFYSTLPGLIALNRPERLDEFAKRMNGHLARGSTVMYSAFTDPRLKHGTELVESKLSAGIEIKRVPSQTRSDFTYNIARKSSTSKRHPDGRVSSPSENHGMSQGEDTCREPGVGSPQNSRVHYVRLVGRHLFGGIGQLREAIGNKGPPYTNLAEESNMQVDDGRFAYRGMRLKLVGLLDALEKGIESRWEDAVVMNEDEDIGTTFTDSPDEAISFAFEPYPPKNPPKDNFLCVVFRVDKTKNPAWRNAKGQYETYELTPPERILDVYLFAEDCRLFLRYGREGLMISLQSFASSLSENHGMSQNEDVRRQPAINPERVLASRRVSSPSEDLQMGTLRLGQEEVPLYFNIDSFWQISQIIKDAPGWSAQDPLCKELASGGMRVLLDNMTTFQQELTQLQSSYGSNLATKNETKGKRLLKYLRTASQRNPVRPDELTAATEKTQDFCGSVVEGVSTAKFIKPLQDTGLQQMLRNLMYRYYFSVLLGEHMRQIFIHTRFNGVINHSDNISRYVATQIEKFRKDFPNLKTSDFTKQGEMPRIRYCPQHIQVILEELIKNAFNYGGTKLSGSLRVEDRASQPNLIIEVSDNGQGIPEEIMGMVELIGYSSNPGIRKATEGGVGFGLFKLHAYSRFHKGSFEIESIPGEGTKARVVLPVEALQDRGSSPASSPGENHGMSQGQDPHKQLGDRTDASSSAERLNFLPNEEIIRNFFATGYFLDIQHVSGGFYNVFVCHNRAKNLPPSKETEGGYILNDLFREGYNMGFFVMFDDQEEIQLHGVHPQLPPTGQGLGRAAIVSALLMQFGSNKRSKKLSIRPVYPKAAERLKQLEHFQIKLEPYGEKHIRITGVVPMIEREIIDRLQNWNVQNKQETVEVSVRASHEKSTASSPINSAGEGIATSPQQNHGMSQGKGVNIITPYQGDIFLFGGSTGGWEAFKVFIHSLPDDCSYAPIVYSDHLICSEDNLPEWKNDLYDIVFAFADESHRDIILIQRDGEWEPQDYGLQRGRIIIGHFLGIERKKTGYPFVRAYSSFRQMQAMRRDLSGYRGTTDLLCLAAAQIAEFEKIKVAILSGSGFRDSADGVSGAQAVHDKGGEVFAQGIRREFQAPYIMDMPAAVIEAGIPCKEVPIENMAVAMGIRATSPQHNHGMSQGENPRKQFGVSSPGSDSNPPRLDSKVDSSSLGQQSFSTKISKFLKAHINWVIALSIVLTAGFAALANFYFPFILSSVPFYVNMMIYFGLAEIFSQSFSRLKEEQSGFDYPKILIAVLLYGLIFGLVWNQAYFCYQNFIPNSTLAGKCLRVFIDQTAGATICILWTVFVSGFYDKFKAKSRAEKWTLSKLLKIAADIWQERKANFVWAMMFCWLIWVPIQYFNLNSSVDSHAMVSAISVAELPWSILWILLANLKGSRKISNIMPRSIAGLGIGTFSGFFIFHLLVLYYGFSVTTPLSVLLVSIPAFGLVGLVLANIVVHLPGKKGSNSTSPSTVDPSEPRASSPGENHGMSQGEDIRRQFGDALPQINSERETYAQVDRFLAERGVSEGRRQAVIFALQCNRREHFMPQVMTTITLLDSTVVVFSIGSYQLIMSNEEWIAYEVSLLDLQGGERVLEIGTGTGRTTAIILTLLELAQRGGVVYAVEKNSEVLAFASANIKRSGERRMKLIEILGDGTQAIDELSGNQFERILIRGALPGGVPAILFDRLQEGGIMVAPIAHPHPRYINGMHQLWRFIKQSDGSIFGAVHDSQMRYQDIDVAEGTKIVTIPGQRRNVEITPDGTVLPEQIHREGGFASGNHGMFQDEGAVVRNGDQRLKRVIYTFLTISVPAGALIVSWPTVAIGIFSFKGWLLVWGFLGVFVTLFYFLSGRQLVMGRMRRVLLALSLPLSAIAWAVALSSPGIKPALDFLFKDNLGSWGLAVSAAIILACLVLIFSKYFVFKEEGQSVSDDWQAFRERLHNLFIRYRKRLLYIAVSLFLICGAISVAQIPAGTYLSAGLDWLNSWYAPEWLGNGLALLVAPLLFSAADYIVQRGDIRRHKQKHYDYLKTLILAGSFFVFNGTFFPRFMGFYKDIVPAEGIIRWLAAPLVYEAFFLPACMLIIIAIDVLKQTFIRDRNSFPNWSAYARQRAKDRLKGALGLGNMIMIGVLYYTLIGTFILNSTFSDGLKMLLFNTGDFIWAIVISAFLQERGEARDNPESHGMSQGKNPRRQFGVSAPTYSQAKSLLWDLEEAGPEARLQIRQQLIDMGLSDPKIIDELAMFIGYNPEHRSICAWMALQAIAKRYPVRVRQALLKEQKRDSREKVDYFLANLERGTGSPHNHGMSQGDSVFSEQLQRIISAQSTFVSTKEQPYPSIRYGEKYAFMDVAAVLAKTKPVATVPVRNADALTLSLNQEAIKRGLAVAQESILVEDTQLQYIVAANPIYIDAIVNLYDKWRNDKISLQEYDEQFRRLLGYSEEAIVAHREKLHRSPLPARESMPKRIINLHELIESVARDCRGISLKLNLWASRPFIAGDENRLTVALRHILNHPSLSTLAGFETKIRTKYSVNEDCIALEIASVSGGVLKPYLANLRNPKWSLAQVRETINLHNGTITAEFSPHTGTVFSIKLPAGGKADSNEGKITFTAFHGDGGKRAIPVIRDEDCLEGGTYYIQALNGGTADISGLFEGIIPIFRKLVKEEKLPASRITIQVLGFDPDPLVTVRVFYLTGPRAVIVINKAFVSMIAFQLKNRYERIKLYDEATKKRSRLVTSQIYSIGIHEIRAHIKYRMRERQAQYTRGRNYGNINITAMVYYWSLTLETENPEKIIERARYFFEDNPIIMADPYSPYYVRQITDIERQRENRRISQPLFYYLFPSEDWASWLDFFRDYYSSDRTTYGELENTSFGVVANEGNRREVKETFWSARENHGMSQEPETGGWAHSFSRHLHQKLVREPSVKEGDVAVHVGDEGHTVLSMEQVPEGSQTACAVCFYPSGTVHYREDIRVSELAGAVTDANMSLYLFRRGDVIGIKPDITLRVLSLDVQAKTMNIEQIDEHGDSMGGVRRAGLGDVAELICTGKAGIVHDNDLIQRQIERAFRSQVILPRQIVAIGDEYREKDELALILALAGVIKGADLWQVTDKFTKGKGDSFAVIFADLTKARQELLAAVMNLQEQANGRDEAGNIYIDGPIVVLNSSTCEEFLEDQLQEWFLNLKPTWQTAGLNFTYITGIKFEEGTLSEKLQQEDRKCFARIELSEDRSEWVINKMAILARARRPTTTTRIIEGEEISRRLVDRSQVPVSQPRLPVPVFSAIGKIKQLSQAEDKAKACQALESVVRMREQDTRVVTAARLTLHVIRRAQRIEEDEQRAAAKVERFQEIRAARGLADSQQAQQRLQVIIDVPQQYMGVRIAAEQALRQVQGIGVEVREPLRFIPAGEREQAQDVPAEGQEQAKGPPLDAREEALIRERYGPGPDAEAIIDIERLKRQGRLGILKKMRSIPRSEPVRAALEQALRELEGDSPSP
ncbi:MAG: hypothetical protein JSW40_05535 [Candidatus Omnitrophota bacterium]|nr:MAG: hypothetical protein JSW40_05535 [Candidatus Omnitrophota bacterium]